MHDAVPGSDDCEQLAQAGRESHMGRRVNRCAALRPGVPVDNKAIIATATHGPAHEKSREH
jgi:hypothetical protein